MPRDLAADADSLTRREGEHLTPTVTDRGFKWMPPVLNRWSTKVTVSESSNADGPHLWLRIEQTNGVGSAMQLDLEAARILAEQIEWIIANHYQIEAPK